MTRATDTWRDQLRLALDAEALYRDGWIDAASAAVAVRYPVRVTPYYLSLARRGDPQDPILRQCLPDVRELRDRAGFVDDPFHEKGAAAFCPGVKRRFPDRVLVMANLSCAMACRHCTRKNLLADSRSVCSDIEGAVARIVAHPEIREVLISGGDPMMLSDTRLLAFVRAFARLEQIDAVRIGTRVPVVLPMRVTEELAHALGRFGKVWVNTQFNHPRELTAEAATACARLVDAGLPVSNQSVLLAGVNDDLETMVALCAGLQRMRVRPYYVFQCDPVAGTAHFRVPMTCARSLARGVAARLGGLAVPRFVADLPGAPSKRPVV